ncbi:hypothetical protein PHJA_002261400 [Phtheirospermum japonicum]|uniref:Helitron helicase-like domain-containing protein n=1 Tax=Phtheirospermum japonicum TaxID=374723 RepID=A0A830CYE0_9LAMI|nr:hypothetical protein PHJA_002261400 [Phtheirospermum japonicum]
MDRKRKCSTLAIDVDIDSEQSKNNRFERYNILKSKKFERRKSRPAIFKTAHSHGQNVHPPIIPDNRCNEMFMPSDMSMEGNVETVSIDITLPDKVLRCSSDTYTIGSQIFNHESMSFSTTNPKQSSVVGDRLNITVGHGIALECVPTSSHLRRHYDGHSFGGPDIICPFCQAMMWDEERVTVSPRVGYPVFSICCKQGMIQLPPAPSTPDFLDDLLHPQSENLSLHLRKTLGLNGQTHHRLGSLLPLPGHNARYVQLYIYDTTNEVSNRISSVFGTTDVTTINRAIVEGLMMMLNECDEIAKAFRMARDRYKAGETEKMRLRLLNARGPNRKNYAPPDGSDIAALIVGDIGGGNGDRDVIVEHRTDGLKTNQHLASLIYAHAIPTIISVRRRWQFITDSFSATDEERLHYIRNNQKRLRLDMYKDVRDEMHQGDVQGKSIGKRVILPTSFTGSSRYLFQNYQDALAICRCYGLPDLFLTFTYNAQWDEQALQLIHGQRSEDRPDIIARVFKLKLAQLLNDLMKEAHFGKALAEWMMQENFVCARYGFTTPKLIMRLNLTLQDKTGKLEAVVFGTLAEKLSGYQLASSVISAGVQNDHLLEEVKAIINEEHIFNVGLTQQASNQVLLKYKVFAFLLKSTNPDKEIALMENEAMGSGATVEKSEENVTVTALSPVSCAIPEDLFVDESPAKKIKSS